MNIWRRNTKIGWLLQIIDNLLIFTENDIVGAAAPEIVRYKILFIYRYERQTKSSFESSLLIGQAA